MKRRQGAGFAAQLVGLAVLYVVSGYLGLDFAHYEDHVTLVWPPTGLALAALILYGIRLWPGVFFGALVLSLTRGDAWLPGVGIAVGNTLEAVVGALLLVRVADFRPNFERMQDVIAFLVLGTLACTLVSATIGVSTLVLSGGVAQAEAGMVWFLWWLGDAGGAVIVTPFLLLARLGSPPWRALAVRPEAWLVLVLAVAAGFVAFGGVATGSWALLAAFAPFPLLTWAGGRLGPRGAVTVVLGISAIATLGTARGHGPLVAEGTHQSMLLLWAYAMTVGWTGLALAASYTQRDRTERLHRKGDDERLRIERRLHEAQRLEALGLLAGGVAHDFNNVLTVIRGNAVLLGDRLAGDATGVSRVRKIEAAADRAADFCKRLLAYAGREPPVREAVLLPDLVKETCALVRTFVPTKVTLDTSTAADTPAVEGDATQLQQVVMNLVLNAAEAIGDCAGTIRIEAGRAELDASAFDELTNASSASPGCFGFVEVCDTGTGMDPETLQRIFDPFFSTKVEGRGLGLASVLGIVRGHGGVIDVWSEPGRGSRFRVYVPESVSEAPPQRASAPVSEVRGEGRLVLVAEDEPDIGELVVHVLQAAGYRTLAVLDGLEALDQVRRRSAEIDAVLLDVTMPEMSGTEVLAAIRALGTQVPIILMSGHEADRAHGDLVPDGFVRKPFDNDALVAEVGRALARHAGVAP